MSAIFIVTAIKAVIFGSYAAFRDLLSGQRVSSAQQTANRGSGPYPASDPVEQFWTAQGRRLKRAINAWKIRSNTSRRNGKSRVDG